MAAPGSKEGTFCERCFAHVGKGETYCPECGAPVGDAAPAADSAVHGELAQANLLRLRGELDAAEKALLAILRRFPNDPHAHEMLGDVCADRGEADRAIEWYELALDLSPNSTDVRRKLDETRERLEARETADTAQQIGLPAPASPLVWWPLAASVAILALAVLIVAWPRKAAPAPYRATVAAVESPAAPISTDPEPKPPETAPPVETPATGADEDRRLLTELRKGAEGARVQSVAADPRGTLSLTFEAAESDDPKALALSLGQAALAAVPTATAVSLRAVRARVLVFAADLSRAAMGGDEPLTNVWPAPSASAGTSSAEPAAPPAGGVTGSPLPSGGEGSGGEGTRQR